MRDTPINFRLRGRYLISRQEAVWNAGKETSIHKWKITIYSIEAIDAWNLYRNGFIVNLPIDTKMVDSTPKVTQKSYFSSSSIAFRLMSTSKVIVKWFPMMSFVVK